MASKRIKFPYRKKKYLMVKSSNFHKGVLYILLILTLFSLIILIFLHFRTQQEFIIYKNKCYNETYLLGYFEYPEWNGSLSKFPELNEINMSFSLISSCSSCAIPILKEGENTPSFVTINKIKNIRKTKDKIVGDVKVCSKNETDRIIYVTDNFYKCQSGYDRVLFECLDNYVHTIYLKDLNETWLKEHSDMARCTSCEDLECKNQKCDLYCVGDYEVEVLK